MSKKKYIQDVHRFSKQWWFNGLRNLFWVTVVTVLVWVYADMEQIRSAEISAVIRLSTGNSENIQLLSKQQLRLDFTVRGNHKNLEQFKRDLATRGGVVTYDVSKEELSPGEHSVSTTDILRRAANIERAGLTVVSTSVGEIKIELDELLRKTVGVRFDYINAVPGSVEIEPHEIPIRVGAKAWESIREKLPKPSIATVQTDLNTAISGEKVPVVASIAGIPVQPEIDRVTVRFEIKERIRTENLKVAVHVLAPPTWHEDDTWRRYDLQRKDRDEWLPQITVRGPRKDVEQLLARKDEILAYVTLTENDKNPSETYPPHKVLIRFPKGLQLELAGEVPPVHFKLVERSAAVTAP